MYVSCGDYFWSAYCLPVFHPKERERERKGMKLHGKGVGKNLGRVLGEGSVIRIYCMIFFK